MGSGAGLSENGKVENIDYMIRFLQNNLIN
jgi:hypothetical protein